MRFSNKFLAVIAAVAVVTVAAGLAMAQNEQGKGGRGRGRGGPGGPGGMGGPPSMARLAMIPKVQEELKITDEQKTKIEKINADFRKGMGDRPDPEKMKQMRDEQNDKLKEVLDAGQQKRMMGIFVQLMGAGAVMDPAVGKEIGLTDEQKDKLHEAMGPPPEGGRGGGDRQSFADRRAKQEKEVMAILTPDQQKKLESLKGDKVDIDMSALRGGGGGQGRGRGRGNRSADSDSK